MPKFKCNKCGHKYFDSDNFAPCPACLGLGVPSDECTCTYWRFAFSNIKSNFIKTKDSQCPIHGKEIEGEY